MATGFFQLVGFDEGGIKGASGNRRLVCLIESGGKLAIWGQEVPERNMRNIEAVLKAGMPCTVECQFREPGASGVVNGHTHWVRQDYELKISS